MRFALLLATPSLLLGTHAFPSIPSSRELLLQTARFQWPLYSQQCQDDAGPAFEDDVEIFGPGGKYHDNSRATAVLKDGRCAGPVMEACEARANANGGQVTPDIARAAYLEGPLQCGGRGWFCRILPDPAHDGGDQSDWNFNHCNRTEYGDTDGHCHGSDNDDTFYWWVRDHWHRNYAGRLHCCCNWEATLGVVARCDYRAPLQPGENAACRDANEDHTGPGSGFSLGFEAGCPNLGTTDPLPEPDEGQCWDVLYFAPGDDDGGSPDGGGGGDQEEEDEHNSWEEEEHNSWEEEEHNSWEEDEHNSWEEEEHNSWEEEEHNSWEEDEHNSWEEEEHNSWEEAEGIQGSWWRPHRRPKPTQVEAKPRPHRRPKPTQAEAKPVEEPAPRANGNRKHKRHNRKRHDRRQG